MITVFIRVRRAILRLERNKLFSLAAEQVALGRPSRSRQVLPRQNPAHREAQCWRLARHDQPSLTVQLNQSLP